jgi:hypothetical protein
MLDILTQKTSSTYKFYRGHQPKRHSYYERWGHFFVVPNSVPRSFLGDNLVDPEGSRIRLRIPPPDRPPNADPDVAGPNVINLIADDPSDGAAAAGTVRAEVAAATTSRSAPSSSREIARGKRKIVPEPRSVSPPTGSDC